MNIKWDKVCICDGCNKKSEVGNEEETLSYDIVVTGRTEKKITLCKECLEELRNGVNQILNQTQSNSIGK